MSTVNKFGKNTDIDTGSTPEDVWDGGGLWVPPTAARIHDVASSNAADTSAGTGARTVRIYGLDSNWELQEEDITMNGTTNVPTAAAYTRVFRAQVLTAGSGDVNAGDITITAQTDSTVTAQITAGKGQTLMAIYTVPAGKTGYGLAWYGMLAGSSPSGAQVDLDLLVRTRADQSDSALNLRHSGGLFSEGSSRFQHRVNAYFPIEEKSDIIVRVADVSANNTNVAAGFEMLLQDN